MTKKAKTIGLALGGGGARGCAHIGVIKALKEAGFEINFVAGTSIGALVGGIYAKGKIDVLEYVLRQTKWQDVVKNFDPVIPKKGLFEGKKVVRLMEKIIPGANFSNLEIPFIAVATDLLTGNEVHIKNGNLINAIRASIAIPGIITPIKINNKYLVDGGVTNPLPVNVVREMGADIIIGVDLNRSFLKRHKFSRQNFQKNRLVKWIAPSPNILDVIESSLFALQDQLTQKNLMACQPDFLIQPELGSAGIFDLHKADALIKKGYDEAQKIIGQLKKQMKY